VENGSVFYGDGESLDEALGSVLELTSKYGLLGQAKIAECFDELVSASLELGQTLPAHTFIVSMMDTQRN
jgi:hypothetical protein